VRSTPRTAMGRCFHRRPAKGGKRLEYYCDESVRYKPAYRVYRPPGGCSKALLRGLPDAGYAKVTETATSRQMGGRLGRSGDEALRIRVRLQDVDF
jgi:hypothetical protein